MVNRLRRRSPTAGMSLGEVIKRYELAEQRAEKALLQLDTDGLGKATDRQIKEFADRKAEMDYALGSVCAFRCEPTSQLRIAELSLKRLIKERR